MPYKRNPDTLAREDSLAGAPVFRAKYRCSNCTNPIDKEWASPDATCYNCGKKEEYLHSIEKVEATGLYFRRRDWGELDGPVIDDLKRFAREILDAKQRNHTNKMVSLLEYAVETYSPFENYDVIMIPPSSSLGPNHMTPKARAISNRFDIPFDDAIVEVDSTGQMKNKSSASTRRKSAKDSYRCDSDVSDKRVLILDDIVTSGNTVTAIGEELLNEGAVQVGVASMARSVDEYTLVDKNLIKEIND